MHKDTGWVEGAKKVRRRKRWFIFNEPGRWIVIEAKSSLNNLKHGKVYICLAGAASIDLHYTLIFLRDFACVKAKKVPSLNARWLPLVYRSLHTLRSGKKFNRYFKKFDFVYTFVIVSCFGYVISQYGTVDVTGRIVILFFFLIITTLFCVSKYFQFGLEILNDK